LLNTFHDRHRPTPAIQALITGNSEKFVLATLYNSLRLRGNVRPGFLLIVFTLLTILSRGNLVLISGFPGRKCGFRMIARKTHGGEAMGGVHCDGYEDVG